MDDLQLLQRLLRHNMSPLQIYQTIQANLEFERALADASQASSSSDEGESALVDNVAKLNLRSESAGLQAEPIVVSPPQQPIASSQASTSGTTPEVRPREMAPGVPWPTSGTQSTSLIRRFMEGRPQAYSRYQATADDTGTPGPTRFRVALGNDVYACFPKQKPAEMLAKIVRAHGIRHPMVAGRIFYWPVGSTPLPVDPLKAASGATHRDPASIMPEW